MIIQLINKNNQTNFDSITAHLAMIAKKVALIVEKTPLPAYPTRTVYVLDTFQSRCCGEIY